MTNSQYLRGLRGRWWLLLAGLLLGGAVAGGASMATTPHYEAGTELFVSTSGSEDVATAVQGSEFSQRRVASYARLLAGKDMAAAIIDRLRLPMTPDELMTQIEASAVPDTVLLDVTVTDPSPERALAIARAVEPEFTQMVRALETPDGATRSPVKVTVVSTPELPTSAASPNLLRNVAVGLFLGLSAGLGLALLRTRFDTAVKDEQAASAAVGAPVIGQVVLDTQLARTHTVDLSGAGRTAEGFRQIRTNLQFLQVDSPPRVLMVSSSLPAEGKSTVAVNLAVALAQSGRSVTLVDADLRRPRAARYLGKVTGVGLTNVLNGTADLDEVLQPHGAGRLAVLASGPVPPNPGELLSSQAMAGVLAELAGRSDVVIVDAPPLLPIADAVGLAPLVDGVVLCARYGATRQEHLEQSRSVLERVGVSTLGAVLTMVPPRALSGGYAVSYGYAEESQPPRASALSRRRAPAEQHEIVVAAASLRPAASRVGPAPSA